MGHCGLNKGGQRCPLFESGTLGLRFAIEEARSELEACEKTGRDSQECEVERVPEEIILREASNDSPFPAI
jgi:hypothetical protein